MRPVRLILKAFGPYAAEQEFDFGELKNNSLFLIHGPTGSGKTTILDAMCFALYGDCSGNDRKPGQVRSDHADPFLLTEVTFDFSLAGRIYRVYRRPEQLRPKRKGEGMTTARAEAFLEELPAQCEGKSTLIAAQWNAVTAAVEQLLGFRSEQFRQVVVLPQGEFRRLLLADSRERQAILEVLFQTEFYRRIEEALKDAAKSIEQNVQVARNSLKIVINQAESESLEELDEKIQNARSELEALRENSLKLKQVEQTAQETLSSAKQIVEKLDELDAAQNALNELEKGLEINAERKNELERARKAAILFEAEKTLHERLKEAEIAETHLNKTKQELKKASLEKKEAEEKLISEEERYNTTEELSRELIRLEALVDKVRQIETLKNKTGAAKKQLDVKISQFQEAREKLAELKNNLVNLNSEKNEAEKEVSLIELFKLKCGQLENALAQKKKLDDLAGDQEKKIKKHKQVSKELIAKETELQEALKEYSSLDKAWRKGQAAILARDLTPGKPCPVCGSNVHPSPAVLHENVPEEESLKAKSVFIDELRSKLENLRETKAQLDSKISELAARADDITENLGEFSQKKATELEALLAEAKQELARAQAASRKAESLEQRSKELTADSIRVEEELNLLEKEKNDLQLTYQTAESEKNAIMNEVPPQYHDLSRLNASITSVQNQITSLKEAYENAKNRLNAANQNFAACIAKEKAANDLALSANEKALLQRQKFEESLRQVGFKDENEYRQAKRSPVEIEKLEKYIKNFDQALSAARDRFDRAKLAAEGLKRPDMESLQKAAVKAESDLQEAIRAEAALVEKLKSWNSAREEYLRTFHELEKMESEYNVIGKIAKVAAGENSYRMNFQRFVLSALLDDVLSAASERFRIMSNGRFRLQRVTRVTDRRSMAGLDLEIYDEYTGTERPVSTLSGGESFLASLSLALGLADIVQAYSGGIHLDTIFVDEGFGSLDPEALDLAFRALLDLQKDGRLVGIISHVPELKERIDVRLEVMAGRNGSKARFIV